MNKSNLIAAVRAYAVANYKRDGWDYVVECWNDDDILEEIVDATTEKQAIACVRKAIKVLYDYRAEIQATAW